MAARRRRRAGRRPRGRSGALAAVVRRPWRWRRLPAGRTGGLETAPPRPRGERAFRPKPRGTYVRMAYPAYIREKARWMRVERRLTIDQIAERLAVSRTTVYYWIRDLPAPVEVTHSARRQAARRKATRAMQRTYRLRREAAYREGEESFDELA